MQKKTHPARPNTSASSNGLGLSRSAHRAVLRASAAVDAGIRVDHKLAITLADRAHRAVAGAHAARDAVIRNLISHTFHLPLFRITPETHFSTSARELQVFCAILPIQIQIKRDFEFPVFRYESTKSGLSPPQLVNISKLGLDSKIKKFSYSFICGKGYSPPFGGRIAFCLQSELPQGGSPFGRISSENKKKLRRKPCAHSRVFFQYAACFPLKPLSSRNVGVTKDVLTARTAESPECDRRCP